MRQRRTTGSREGLARRALALVVALAAVALVAPAPAAGATGALPGTFELFGGPGPELMEPFPEVRLLLISREKRTTFERVTVRARPDAVVHARCAGARCPFRTLVLPARPARQRALERSYPVGAVVEIRVTAAGAIGSYTRLKIRRLRSPARRDGCLPQPCPAGERALVRLTAADLALLGACALLAALLRIVLYPALGRALRRRRAAKDHGRYREADRLLRGAASHGGLWVGALALAAIASAGGALALPAVLAGAVDAVIGDGAPGPWLVWLALLVALLAAAETLNSLAAGAATARSTAWLRHALWQHVLAMERDRGERYSRGDLASRLVGNAAQAGRVAPDVVRATANLIPAVGGTVALALIDPWLCVTFLAGLPILMWAIRVLTRDASDVAAGYLGVQGTIAGRLVEAMSGGRTIAAAGTLRREVDRVLGPLPELRRHGLGMWRTQMRISAQDVLTVSLLKVAVLAVAGAQLARGRISPGEMLAASQYVVLASAIGSSITAMARLARSRAGAARLAEVLAEPRLEYGTARLPPGRGRLELHGVTACAGGRPVLEGIDLVVPAGTLVAVVGRTGSGKSLLAALIGRLIDPEDGDVLLDGVPLRQLAHDELRRAVGYGFERPALIGDTLADVIAFGAHTPRADDVVAAACAAQADGFIRRFPEGYRTPVADAPMSGGEAQRMGIARAFAHAGRVLVLDDVAASLDTVTEHNISRVLATALVDRTRVVVAHRASTAVRADLVVWLHERGVRAVGPHERLRHEAEYRALFAPERPAAGPPAEGIAVAGGVA